MLAPADGTVVRANGDARDWPAYRKGSDPGNYVIIEHAPGEYTEFRHLAADSVTLAAGARVRRGDVIGRCGNSGNAGMPHLHIGFLSLDRSDHDAPDAPLRLRARRPRRGVASRQRLPA